VNAGDVIRTLQARRVADWVLTTRDQDVAVVDDRGPLRRREARVRWTLVVHVDVSNGRGSARVDLAGHDGDAGQLVDQAVALARAAVGTAWRSLPQAAPARVELADPALDILDLEAVADSVLRGVPRPDGVDVTAGATVLREHVRVQTMQGLRTGWTATHVRVPIVVARGGRSLAIEREARRAGALDLDGAMATAVADLGAVADAGDPRPGPCRLVLGADALLHGGGYGMWAVFAAQADAVVERQGLTRYREGMVVAPGADQGADPLAIASDGALDHGVRSAPVGDDGDAIRRFAVVDRGRAAGLALSPREASLRTREPNGGVRELVVAAGAPGDVDEASAGDDGDLARTVELRRLRSLAIDPYTGEATMEIALAIDHRDGAPRAFAGGTVRLDLIAALARGRRAHDVIHRTPYHGPAWLAVADAGIA
jgi:hypothetical protein